MKDQVPHPPAGGRIGSAACNEAAHPRRPDKDLTRLTAYRPPGKVRYSLQLQKMKIKVVEPLRTVHRCAGFIHNPLEENP
ncbi:hypothetical protein [Noviherbaspirillum humi]|uniref:hypothetical protein n=1 Tax=Noviherbaspirillum humi TaxID=1688639 RepID=UPI00116055E5|nr:hypothetical protein [Noviherbaspirillum humi]